MAQFTDEHLRLIQQLRAITPAQITVLEQMTDGRCAAMMQLADIIRDMNSEGLEFLRRLGDPRYEAMTHFLSRAEPSTLDFLAKATPEQIETLNQGLKLVVAIQLLGRIGKWCMATAFGAFVGGILIWEKVSAWLKGR